MRRSSAFQPLFLIPDEERFEETGFSDADRRFGYDELGLAMFVGSAIVFGYVVVQLAVGLVYH
jgi:hypothetical protein